MKTPDEIESEFVAKIDCRFPYSDEVGARELILEASRISDNAVLQVVWEVLKPPSGVELHEPCRKMLFNEIRAHARKSVKGVVDAAERFSEGHNVALHEVIRLLELVKSECQNCHNAVGILTAVVDDADAPEVERIGQVMIRRWTKDNG